MRVKQAFSKLPISWGVFTWEFFSRGNTTCPQLTVELSHNTMLFPHTDCEATGAFSLKPEQRKLVLGLKSKMADQLQVESWCENSAHSQSIEGVKLSTTFEMATISHGSDLSYNSCVGGRGFPVCRIQESSKIPIRLLPVFPLS